MHPPSRPPDPSLTLTLWWWKYLPHYGTGGQACRQGWGHASGLEADHILQVEDPLPREGWCSVQSGESPPLVDITSPDPSLKPTLVQDELSPAGPRQTVRGDLSGQRRTWPSLILISIPNEVALQGASRDPGGTVGSKHTGHSR